MAEVRGKIDSFTAADPLAAMRDEDPWAAFREVERVAIRSELRFRHSLGKYSRFFLELENGRFFATRCPGCGKVWAPPRPLCPDDRLITEWTELPGTGTLAGFSVIHRAPAFITEPVPYVLASVRLDDADTLFLHILRGVPPERVRVGQRVRVAYATEPVDHPLHLIWFEPAE